MATLLQAFALLMVISVKSNILATDICTPNPCQNGGKCADEKGSILCECALGWAGARCTVSCDVVQSDLTFLIDTSGSIEEEGFEQQMRFLKGFANLSNIGPRLIGVTTFSESSKNKIWFNMKSYNTKSRIRAAIDKIDWSEGNTDFTTALRAVNNSWDVSEGGRFGVRDILIMTTDGHHTTGDDPNFQIPAEDLRDKGVIILAVSVGRKVHYPSLRNITGRDDRITNASSFVHLNELIPQILQEECVLADTSDDMGKLNLAVRDSEEKDLYKALGKIDIPVERGADLQKIMELLKIVQNNKPDGTLVVEDIQDALHKVILHNVNKDVDEGDTVKLAKHLRKLGHKVSVDDINGILNILKDIKTKKDPIPLDENDVKEAYQQDYLGYVNRAVDADNKDSLEYALGKLELDYNVDGIDIDKTMEKLQDKKNQSHDPLQLKDINDILATLFLDQVNKAVDEGNNEMLSDAMSKLDYPVPNEIIDDVLNSLSQTKRNRGVPLVVEDIKNAYQAVFIYRVNVAVDGQNDAELDEALKELGIEMDDQDMSDFRERLEDIKQQHMLDIKDIHKAYQEFFVDKVNAAVDGNDTQDLDVALKRLGFKRNHILLIMDTLNIIKNKTKPAPLNMENIKQAYHLYDLIQKVNIIVDFNMTRNLTVALNDLNITVWDVNGLMGGLNKTKQNKTIPGAQLTLKDIKEVSSLSVSFTATPDPIAIEVHPNVTLKCQPLGYYATFYYIGISKFNKVINDFEPLVEVSSLMGQPQGIKEYADNHFGDEIRNRSKLSGNLIKGKAFVEVTINQPTRSDLGDYLCSVIHEPENAYDARNDTTVIHELSFASLLSEREVLQNILVKNKCTSSNDSPNANSLLNITVSPDDALAKHPNDIAITCQTNKIIIKTPIVLRIDEVKKNSEDTFIAKIEKGSSTVVKSDHADMSNVKGSLDNTGDIFLSVVLSGHIPSDKSEQYSCRLIYTDGKRDRVVDQLTVWTWTGIFAEIDRLEAEVTTCLSP